MSDRYSIINASPEQVSSAGGQNLQVASYSGVIFATLTEEQANALREQGCSVAPVGKVKSAGSGGYISPPVPVPGAAKPLYTPLEVFNIAGLGEIRDKINPNINGEGFNIAIIGTGIRETHQLVGGVVYSKNYTSDPMRDGFNHDTGVASIIRVVAPKCGILNLKVMNDKGEGTTEAVVMAIEQCIDLLDTNPDIAPTVINMSLGAPDTGDYNDPMRIACRAAIDRQIWPVAAAGNAGPYASSITSPACEKYVYAVGSVGLIAVDGQYTFKVSDFSSRGPTLAGLVKPDGVFIGEDISMASSDSDTATTAKSGTSFAAPFCSGIAVLYKQGVLVITMEKETGMQYLGTMPVGEYTLSLLTIEKLMDQYMKYITIKPQGVTTSKDEDYGWGLPFGTYITNAMQQAAAGGGGAVTGMDMSAMVGMMMVVMMMGVMMKSMTPALAKVRK